MRRELPFVTLDVFAKARFQGNPLAVVTIPRSTHPKPTQQEKQTIAREFNLSETVFVHENDPADEDDDTTQRTIDIFLPTQEIPFAGHPTIGTAVSLLPLGVTTIVTKAGPIAITQPVPGTVQAAIPHKTHLHAARLRDLPSLTPGLVSGVAEIRDAELAAPIFSIVDGMSFVLVELPSLDLLSKVALSNAVFPQDKLLDAKANKAGFLAPYFYVRLAEEPGKVSLRSRLMLGSFEDPATGSAACCLSAFLSLHQGHGKDSLINYEITQGVEMGRDSHILVQVATKGAEIDTVHLAGTATHVMRGYISY